MKKNRRRRFFFLRDEREDIFVGDGVPDVPSARQRRAVIARREAPRQSVFFFWGERGDFLIVFMKHAGDVDDMIFADEMDAKIHSTK